MTFRISSNKFIFNQSNSYYENALKKSGYYVYLKYPPTKNQDENNQEREQRKRKILWFNLKTNVGRLFLFIILQGHNKFHKIFNRNIKNMGSTISSHNKEVLNPVTKIMDATAGRMKAVR